MHHAGTHDQALVALSILIAIVASYTALDLAARMRASTGRAAQAWLAAAAIALGGGIWSMHFVAMLAFSVPGAEATYDLGLTLLSLALPILVTAAGLVAAVRSRGSIGGILLSGLVIGLGIAAMHYTGMAAMRIPADLRHDRLWVAIAVLIAIGASTAALFLAFRHAGFLQRVGAAVVMGLAVAGMHYAAMQGAAFTPFATADGAAGLASVDQVRLAFWVTATTFLILLLALGAALFDRHVAHLVARDAAALRDSEERFRLLLQSLTDHAIFMLDVTGRVTTWNAGAERIKGYRADEIIGRHFSTFYPEEDRRAGLPDRALHTAEHVGKFEHEGWRVRKDGTRFWANVIIDPIRDETGTLRGFAKITRDISERKRAEEALERARDALAQAQKMEAVGQLTGGVAHDFNNLLMAILGSLELLRKRLPDDPRLVRLVDNAMQGAQRGAALTQRLLAFARRQDLKPEPVHVPDLVRGMSDLLQRSTGPHVRIETRFPMDLPRALVDSNQLELALLNLVVNARDALKNANGTITIAARELAPDELGDAVAPGRYVCLSVTDEGTGMDAETLARAKEPFFTTKGVGKGTGLGLSMVHGLAEQSKGRLVLKSRLGEGTTAEIWLPVAAAAPMLAPAPAGTSSPVQAGPAESLAILVVDDDLLVLDNTVAMLEDLGHRPIAAHSAAEALDHLARAIPDMLITDQAMPEMTGLELIDQVRARHPGLPIVLATGYAERPAETHHAGVVRLDKPFAQPGLAASLAAALKAAPQPGRVLKFRNRSRSDNA